MSAGPLRVACIGIGWWSDVLADAIQRSGKLEIVSCYTRSEEKRKNFAAKYRCRPAASYEAMLADTEIEAIINTTPNDVHLATTSAAAAAGKHVFLDKPIANSVADGRAITEACRKAGVVLALGYQRRRESHFRWIRQQIDAGLFGKLVNAEANISRDRLGKIDLTSWRYQAAGMPGGVMLQIGIHYIDVLEYLIGPVHAVRGQSAQLVLPGDNPDVASLILEHENGALSTVNASYASASEYYLMNIYGKDATAYYDLHNGLRLLKRGENRARGGAMRQERHPGRGAGGVCGGSSRAGPARSRRRVRDDIARGRARRHSLGARGTPGRGRGDIGRDRNCDRATARTGARHETEMFASCRHRHRDGTPCRHRAGARAGLSVPVDHRDRAVPPGGASDVVARIVTNQMSKTLGQSFVIENVGGAGGTVGGARVAAAAPDGYTLLAAAMGSHVAAPVLTPNVKYDPAADFVPIGITAHSPAVVIARKDFPAQT